MDGHRLPDAVRAALDDPLPGERIRVEAAGIPWSALTWGRPDARPCLLIHGVTSSGANWWRLGPGLAATGRRVTAVDLPGHGLTGHWMGHHRFRDNARDVAAFIRTLGLDRPDLQVVGHSWGAMTAAALPAVGIRPATLVLVDPPVLPQAEIAAVNASSDEHVHHTMDSAIEAVRAENPGWSDGDVLAKAEALTQLDEAAARSVLLDNGDWDGGLADLADPAAAEVPVWIIRGDPAAGGYIPDAAVPALAARVGADRLHTIAGAPHSPQRTHPVETLAALLAALDA